MKQHYTDKEYKELLKHLIVLCDTRDQTNQGIIDWFDTNNIRWKKKALKTGDYSFMIEAYDGFSRRDEYFTDELCIERKNSTSELASNFSNASKDDARIFKEMNRMINIENVYLLIENDSIDDIFDGNYRSKLNPDSFLRTMLTWQKRNNMYIYFVKKENMGKMIYELCKHCLDQKILK